MQNKQNEMIRNALARALESATARNLDASPSSVNDVASATFPKAGGTDISMFPKASGADIQMFPKAGGADISMFPKASGVPMQMFPKAGGVLI